MRDLRFLGNIYRIWWLPMITGIVAIGLGVWTLVCPKDSLPVLAYIFAGCLCGAGVFNFIYSFLMSRYNAQWGWALVIGILDILAGVWLFTLPESILVTTFIYIVAIWLLCVAINSVVESLVMASFSPFWLFWMILLLIASIVFIGIFIFNPITTGVVAWMWLGLSLIVYGVYRIILAFHIRNLKKLVP